MTLDLRQLRYFIAVAEEGHVTRAAERLGIQQPPLSRQIQAIERQLDARLFRRKARGVELTDAGRTFLENARAILAQLDRTLETTRRTARGEQGGIAVGYTSGAAFHPLIPRIIRQFRRAFPLVSVTLVEGFPYDLVERTRNDHFDVAFIRTSVAKTDGVVIEQLLEEPVVVALPSEHPLASNKNRGRATLSLKALGGETFILNGHTHGALTMQANALIAACQTVGFTPRIGHVVANNLSRLSLVAADLGIAVVGATMQRMNVEGVVFRQLKGAPQLKTPLNVASRRGDVSPVVRQFLKMAKLTAKSHYADTVARHGAGSTDATNL
jgi:DNA-binding transcriptional LysR family regulator